MLRNLHRLSWAAIGLAGVQVIVGAGMAVTGNPEGWIGGVFFAILYALPLLLIAMALRSRRSQVRTAGGWAAGALAVYYTLVVAGNWSGYSNAIAWFAVAVTAPTVALDLVIFWAAALRRAARRATS